MNFSALFRAIAIEARCRLRWGGVNDETRRLGEGFNPVPNSPYYLTLMDWEHGRATIRWGMFGREDVWIEDIDTGDYQYMQIGYGSHSNCLVIL